MPADGAVVVLARPWARSSALRWARASAGDTVNEPDPRAWALLLEVFEHLPRQGPGDRAGAERALALCGELPPAPDVADLGCGVGGQTLHLAELLPRARIVALDQHAPSVARLRAAVDAHGLAHRVRAVVGDMADPDLCSGGFDLVWSEGALYCIGVPEALRVCRDLLRPGGTLAFTESVWRTADPPPDVAAFFAQEYPGMGWAADVEAALDEAGFDLVGRFTLPDEAWWTDFYTPMEARVGELRRAYAGDAEALAVLDHIAAEPELHRRHAAAYAYEFFVARRR